MDLMSDYNHYPTDWAEIEYESTQEQPYQITTICWDHVSTDGTDDPRQVHKYVYRMSLHEFLEEWMKDYNRLHECVVNIERI